MSIATLLSRKPQRLLGPSPENGGLLLDAVISEAFRKEADATQFPIELGAEISDHVIPKPSIYIMSGRVTDNPMQWASTTYKHAASSTRHLSAFAILLDLMASRQTFDIVTGYLELKNVVLISITSEKTARTRNELDFEAQLLVLNIVETEQVPIPAGMVEVGSQAEGAAPEENAGNKVGKEPSSSLLYDIVEYFF